MAEMLPQVILALAESAGIVPFDYTGVRSSCGIDLQAFLVVHRDLSFQLWKFPSDEASP